MKTVTWIFVSILLLVNVSSFADEYPGTTGFVGGIYDSDVGFSLMIGGLTPIRSTFLGKLYAVGHINPAKSGALNHQNLINVKNNLFTIIQN